MTATGPDERLTPATAGEVLEAVREAGVAGRPLEVVGAGSKRALGRPVQAELTLDVSGLRGIRLYEPEELVLSAEPGTPVAEIEAALTRSGQMLAFEPADWGPLWDQPADRGTLGGAVACNLSGPRRFKAGAARDHVLGFEAVSGRGEAFKSGGRVMKNVTGYDLSKLVTGSFGTLAVLTQVTVKVMPAPEATRTLIVHGLDDDAAVAALTRAVHSPHEVSGAAHLPTAAAARTVLADPPGMADAAATAIRVEGFPESVEARADGLRRELGRLGPVRTLEAEVSRAFWRQVRDVAPFVPTAAAVPAILWRLSVPPAEAPAVLGRIAAERPAAHYLDWAGGLIWLSLEPAEAGPEAAAPVVRAALESLGETAGAHATLVRAPEPLRASVEVLPPQAGALEGLNRRLKAAFDPLGILNPGRLSAGL